MLSERITALFGLLQCSNTDVARFAGCSPSNISRLKSGLRTPGPGSHAVLRLAEGVYRYAAEENMLMLLCELCGTEDTQEGTLIPAVAGWLYEEGEFVPPRAATPKSRRERESRRRSFGMRLDRAMTLLELSNAQLAAPLNVDVSLVSRYRSGVCYPQRNGRIRERLGEALLARAKRLSRVHALAELCSREAADLTAEAVTAWLCETEEERFPGMAAALLRSLDAFTAEGEPVPAAAPELPTMGEAERYWGREGLRSAIVRFLTETAREGGELMLYSDEPMDWLSGDRAYFGQWSALMTACVKSGVRIRIIHNIDRGEAEMFSSISGWIPLYMSGMIEPYVFRRVRNARFFHTVFLRPGGAGILGFFPAEASQVRWYEYITDKARLEAMWVGFRTMLAGASPLLKTYPAARADEFWAYCGGNQAGTTVSILGGFSVATMPEALAERMLRRAEPDEERREKLLAVCRERRRQFFAALERGAVHELLCLPDRETVERGRVRVGFGAELMELSLCYRPEEYREHAAALRALVTDRRNYRLTLLPEAPFRDIRIFTLRDAVAVLRCREPYTAFVLMNGQFTRAVTDYGMSLAEQYGASRSAAAAALEAL